MKFTDETELATFDGWLQYQGFKQSDLSEHDLALWRGIWEQHVVPRVHATPKVGAMKFSDRKGAGSRYAIAVDDGDALWLVLWIRRAASGDVYVIYPHGPTGGNPHFSYHADGRFHSKSYGRVTWKQQRQPISPTFSGCEHIAAFSGYGPSSVGAICEPGMYSAVVCVPQGVLGPRDGCIVIDLLGAGASAHEWQISDHRLIEHRIFDDQVPAISVRVIATAK